MGRPRVHPAMARAEAGDTMIRAGVPVGSDRHPDLDGHLGGGGLGVRFYQKHGFRLVTPADKDRLLPKYWGVPRRQIETSVVLGDERWFAHTARHG